MTSLGLVEMTRKKIQQPFYAQLKRPCPECGGDGFIDSDETLARRILHRLLADAKKNGASCWLIRASSGVAGQLMLIGAPENIRAYVLTEPGRQAFAIEPVSEDGLPGKARRLPRFE